MSLKERITEDMKSAMKAKAALRLSTIRLLRSAIKQREIDEQIVLDDAAVLQVINKMIKQRKDSIDQYQKANRPELADKEQQEIDVLNGYLPAQMNKADIEVAVEKAIKSTDATTARDMGKVMGILKQELSGRADMSLVSSMVKDKLN